MSSEEKWFVVYGNTFAKVCCGPEELPKHIPQFSNWQVHSFDSFTQAKKFAENHLRAAIRMLQREARAIRFMRKGK